MKYIRPSNLKDKDAGIEDEDPLKPVVEELCQAVLK